MLLILNSLMSVEWALCIRRSDQLQAVCWIPYMSHEYRRQWNLKEVNIWKKLLRLQHSILLKIITKEQNPNCWEALYSTSKIMASKFWDAHIIIFLDYLKNDNQRSPFRKLDNAESVKRLSSQGGKNAEFSSIHRIAKLFIMGHHFPAQWI